MPTTWATRGRARVDRIAYPLVITDFVDKKMESLLGSKDDHNNMRLPFAFCNVLSEPSERRVEPSGTLEPAK